MWRKKAGESILWLWLRFLQKAECGERGLHPGRSKAKQSKTKRHSSQKYFFIKLRNKKAAKKQRWTPSVCAREHREPGAVCEHCRQITHRGILTVPSPFECHGARLMSGHKAGDGGSNTIKSPQDINLSLPITQTLNLTLTPNPKPNPNCNPNP